MPRRWYEDTRAVGRFPYHVAILVRDEAIYVLAVAHDRRRPAYWSGREADEMIDLVQGA